MPASLHKSSSPASSDTSSAVSVDNGVSNGIQRTLVRRDKGKAPVSVSAKRKRSHTVDVDSAAHSRRSRPSTVADEDDEEDSDDSQSDDRYDPDQPLEERREIQRGFRELQRDMLENGEEYMQPGSKGLIKVMERAQELVEGVKQTSEATMDARLLAMAAEMSYRKTKRFTQGATSQGVDVDEFVSKCISYMRQGGGVADDDARELSSTQHRTRTAQSRGGAGDEQDETDEMLNWEHLGRFAALPQIRRPALPGFLLGPLSVEKKLRKVAKRSAPFRPGNLTETRPEVINTESLKTKENDLTAICGKILRQLIQVQQRAQDEIQEICESGDLSAAEESELMQRKGLRSTGGIDLFKFIINPKSFGQTVENMFYVSFLIKEGRISIDFDEHDLPSLSPIDMDNERAGRGKRDTAKQQAVLSMDMATWKALIDAFDIRQPMIEHRKEATQGGPGARGWYS